MPNDPPEKNIDVLSEEVIKSAIKTYLACFENNDIEGILDHYADACWVEDPVGSERKTGKDALRKFYQQVFSMSPKAILESDIRVAGNEAAFAFRIELGAAKRLKSVNPIDVMVFNHESKITSMRSFWGPGNQRPLKD